MDLSAPPPWSTGQLKRLGRCIRDQESVPDDVPPYDDVMLYYNDVAAEVQRRIDTLDWESLLDDRPYRVTSRAKTIDTLRQKLQNNPTYPLPSIQDVAGVRFEATMSLTEQDIVAEAIAGLFSHDIGECRKDLREEPHSGYRAVHLRLKLPVRVEVQVRTHLQGMWANMYEICADVLGRGIRYGEMPEEEMMHEVVQKLQDISVTAIAQLEYLRNQWHENDVVLKDLLANSSRRLRRRAPGLQSRLESDWRTVQSLEVELTDSLQDLSDHFDTVRSTLGKR